jgi:hypothetical protein
MTWLLRLVQLQQQPVMYELAAADSMLSNVSHSFAYTPLCLSVVFVFSFDGSLTVV